MKHLLTFILLAGISAVFAWDIGQYGPVGGSLSCASLDRDIPVFGGQQDNTGGIYLLEGGNWEYHPIWMSMFPIRAVCPQSANVIMGAFGDGTYSDGIYNYDVAADTWTLNDWFFWPNFIFWNEANQTYYAGERDGLYKSTSGNGWSRVATLPMNQCDSFAAWGDYAVTDIGNSVYISGDACQSWHLSSMPNLDGFRFASDGTLYAKMDDGSDSDGLWRSDDCGSSWSVEFYTTGLACIGPLYGSSLPLGWRLPYDQEHYAAIYDTQTGLEQLDFAQLDSPVLDIDVFPFINTPSAYFLNANGCHFITGFTTPADDPCLIPPAPDAGLRISPNPARGSIKALASRSFKAPRVSIYDLRGRKLADIDHPLWDKNELRCQLPSLRPGVYMLRVDDGNASYSSRLCVIQ